MRGKKALLIVLMVLLTVLLLLKGMQGEKRQQIADFEEKVVIAHRGACGYLPEHTLESYAVAFALGANYIEPDLVMTKDGVLICLHDMHLERTTDVEEVFPDRHRSDDRWYAADFTLDEIKMLKAHERCDSDGNPCFPDRFPSNFSEFEIPTFAEMIELIRGLNKSTGRSVGIYPELKHPSWHAKEGLPMENALLDTLGKYGYRGPDAKVYIQCFDPESLKKLRFKFRTELPLLQLIGAEGDRVLDENELDEVATYANGIGPDKELVEREPELVSMAHERGLLVHSWTFRADELPERYSDFEEELFQFYFVYGVDGVFTDFPDRAVSLLAKKE